MKKLFLFICGAACAIASWATDVVTAKYNGKTLDIELTNTTKFVAFQMDITVPADANVQGSLVSNIERLAKGEAVMINSVSTETPFELLHNVISTEGGKQVIRVVAYNLGNNEIQKEAGKLFTINFDKAVTEASISEVLFVDDELAEQVLANAVAIPGRELGDVDGINGVTVADAILVLQMIAKKVTDSPAADIDGVNGVTVADAIAVLKIIAKK